MSKSAKNNRIRIIGGNWRGRKLPVVDAPGLRPSGDRCRETLFNWLQPWIAGADCADLFAGTGALGFEAASRGAASVLMIEKNPRVFEALGQSVGQLQAAQVTLVPGGAMSRLAEQQPDSFDIVFVDPPFDSNLAGLVLRRLDQQCCVRDGGFVYVESPAVTHLPPPAGWTEWREQKMGDVRMQLFRRQGSAPERNSAEERSD